MRSGADGVSDLTAGSSVTRWLIGPGSALTATEARILRNLRTSTQRAQLRHKAHRLLVAGICARLDATSALTENRVVPRRATSSRETLGRQGGHRWRGRPMRVRNARHGRLGYALALRFEQCEDARGDIEKAGFVRWRLEDGFHRPLNVWPGEGRLEACPEKCPRLSSSSPTQPHSTQRARAKSSVPARQDRSRNEGVAGSSPAVGFAVASGRALRGVTWDVGSNASRSRTPHRSRLPAGWP